jgi:hypothetical protein
MLAHGSQPPSAFRLDFVPGIGHQGQAAIIHVA